MSKQDAVWTEIDPASLPSKLQEAYAGYKAAYAAMKEARQGFEDAMSAAASPPAGKRLVFGYNFGKLSVALVDDDRKPKAGKPAGTLAQFMAQAQANGHAV